MFKCKICGRTYTDLSGIHSHIEKKHMELVPKNMTVPQYYYFMKTGKTNGNCVMCKQPTSWNKNTNKYNRFCTNPECKEKYVAEFRKRMISKYGKVHLLNDPAKQREMLANRKISGKYKWSDGTESVYTGSYELDFVKLLDLFMEWDPVDISMPSPHTYTYVYEGEERYYIPDVFIHSLDLEIEVKDGGDNPNMHHKIQDVDKVKEKLKDEVLMSQKAFHYIKITNKNYTNFFNFLKKAKEGFAKYEDEKKIPRIFLIEDIKTKSSNVKTLYESTEIEVDEERCRLIEEFAEELEVRDLITESAMSNLTKTVNDLSKLTVFDFEEFVMFSYNAKKNNPEEIKKYIKKLIKSSKTRKDMLVVRNLMRMYVTHTEKMSKNDPTKKALENEYKTWVVGEYQKEYDKKMKKIKESLDYTECYENTDITEEIVMEAIDIDKALVWLDKPLAKLSNKNITLYHGSKDDIKDRYLTPSGINVGATKYSTPRWSTYYWDNYDDAVCWGMTWALQEAGAKILYRGARGKTVVGMNDFDEDTLIQHFINEKICSYVYEVNVPINKLEIGSAPSIKEYTLSEKALITKKHAIKLTRSIFYKYFEFATIDEMLKMRNSFEVKNLIGSRNKLLNNILDKYRDPYRRIVKRELKAGKINIGDDISGYKDAINCGVKHDTLQLKEGAISFTKLNNLLSDKDYERLAKYMDDYESFYREKLKEDPTKSKNINTEVSKARKYIEDLGRTGKVNNDLVKYAVDRIDHSGLCIRPRMESASNIASLSVVVGADTKRSSFGLTDFDTKIFINDNCSIKRPNDINSMNCILSQDNLEDSKDGRRVFKYEVKINNNEIDLDSIIDKYRTDTISIPQMFKLNEATDCKFIKNVCSQLGFGNCEIKLVEDVIY